MATVDTFIDGLRYDLHDYQKGVRWSDTELIVYLNRIVPVINNALCRMNSDLVHGVETGTDTVASQNYVDLSSMNSGNWDSLRSVWIDTDELRRLSLDEIYYERKFIDSEAQPYYWALEGEYLMFERACDQAYTDLIIHYNTKEATLTSTDNMPYNDIFNEGIREALVQMVKAKNRGEAVNTVAMYRTFESMVMAENIRRNWRPKGYHIDF